MAKINLIGIQQIINDMETLVEHVTELTEEDIHAIPQIVEMVMDHDKFETFKRCFTFSMLPDEVVKYVTEDEPIVEEHVTEDTPVVEEFVDWIQLLPAATEEGIRRYQSQPAQTTCYSPRECRNHLPFHIKYSIRKLYEAGKTAKEISNEIQNLHNITLAPDYIQYKYIDGRRPRLYKDIPAEVLDWLGEHKAYVKDGNIFVDGGKALHTRMQTSLTKMTEINGQLYTTKYLVAAIEEIEIPEGSVVTIANRDYRNTSVENLIITPTHVGGKVRINIDDTKTIMNTFAKYKGDSIKVWLELVEEHKIYVSHTLFNKMAHNAWKPEIAKDYYTLEDIKEWHKHEKYIRYIDLTPADDIDVDVVDTPAEVITVAEEETETVEEKNDVKKEKSFPFALINVSNEDKKFMELAADNIQGKLRNISYDDKKFLIRYGVNKNQTTNCYIIQDFLKEFGFKFKDRFIRNIINNIDFKKG